MHQRDVVVGATMAVSWWLAAAALSTKTLLLLASTLLVLAQGQSDDTFGDFGRVRGGANDFGRPGDPNPFRNRNNFGAGARNDFDEDAGFRRNDGDGFGDFGRPTEDPFRRGGGGGFGRQDDPFSRQDDRFGDRQDDDDDHDLFRRPGNQVDEEEDPFRAPPPPSTENPFRAPPPTTTPDPFGFQPQDGFNNFQNNERPSDRPSGGSPGFRRPPGGIRPSNSRPQVRCKHFLFLLLLQLLLLFALLQLHLTFSLCH